MSDRSGQQIVILTYLVVAKVRDRLVAGKQITYRFHMESFNLKKLNENGVK
jgi:hypothetical protein